jgi:hypothetical protein
MRSEGVDASLPRPLLRSLRPERTHGARLRRGVAGPFRLSRSVTLCRTLSEGALIRIGARDEL